MKIKYLKELNIKNKNLENKNKDSNFAEQELPNIDFNKFNDF